MGKTWVVVAESSRARIYCADTPRAPLTEVEDYANPEGRLHDQELTSDLPGRAFDSGGEGRHAMEQRTLPGEREQLAFARTLGQRLEAARRDGELERLVLIAPPEFLGHLRKSLNGSMRELVILELGKNLVTRKPDEVRAQIREQLG